MRSYKMAVYSTSLTDRTVRQVIENTKEEIERGADVYSFHELTPFIPKSNVRFKDIAGSVQTKMNQLCKQPVLRGGIFIAFSKRQFEVKNPQKYSYINMLVDGWIRVKNFRV